MNDFVTTTGQPAPPSKVFFDGKKAYCKVHNSCIRCGGQGGAEAWKHTGWTCYRCGGSGKEQIKEIRLYTAEQHAKLVAVRDKKAANRAAKQEAAQVLVQAQQDAQRNQTLAQYADLIEAAKPYMQNAFISDVIGEAQYGLSVRQIEAVCGAIAREAAKTARPVSQFVGVVGQRQVFTLKVSHVVQIEGNGGYGMPQFYYINICEDSAGNVMIYKGAAWEKDSTVQVKATVKAHEVRKDVNQTIINRPKRQEV